MTDVIERRPDIPGSTLYKDRLLDVVESGESWPEVERRRGPRRQGDAHPDGDDRRTYRAPAAVPLPGVPLVPRSSKSGHHLRGYRKAVIGIDIAAAALGATSAFFLRFGITPHGADSRYVWGIVALPVLWVLGVAISRGYESRFIGSSAEEFRRVGSAGLGLIAAISIVSYASKAEFARGYVVAALPLCVLIATLGRLVARRQLRRVRAGGRCLQTVLVAGHEWAVLDVVAELRQQPGSGLKVVGACLPGGRGSRRMAEAGIPVVGDLSNVAAVVAATGVNVLAVTTCVEFGGPELRQACWQLEETDVDVIVAPALIDVAGPRLHIRPVAGLPLLHVEKPEFAGARRIVKGLFDRTVAGLAVLVLSPLLAALVIAIRLTSPGPAFFRQERIGTHGKRFTMLKFRSMHIDAEDKLAEVRELNERAEGVLFKIRDDPRVTGIGRLLRRYSLDELPQLVNVVKGDMSLVGPRPPLPSEVALYGDDVRRRLLVKPGVTGLWQVSGRSDLTWEESVRLDLRYVENWSLLSDFAILWQTVFAVFKGSGAY